MNKSGIYARIIFIILMLYIAGCGQDGKESGASSKVVKIEIPFSPVGKWILTENYKNTIEFFDDGLMEDGGHALKWVMLSDKRIRVTHESGEMNFYSPDKINQDVIYIKGRYDSGREYEKEYIRYSERLNASYPNLAEAIQLLNQTQRLKYPDDYKKIKENIYKCYELVDSVIEIDKEFGRSYIVGAQCAGEFRHDAIEIGYYTRAFAKDYNNSQKWEPKLLNDLAWTLAVSPDLDLRDNAKALEFAKKAYELEPVSKYADTLAAAYAANNNFPEAIRWQKKAIGADKSKDYEKEYLKRLELYKSGFVYVWLYGSMSINMILNVGLPITEKEIKNNIGHIEEMLISSSWRCITCMKNRRRGYRVFTYNPDGVSKVSDKIWVQIRNWSLDNKNHLTVETIKEKQKNQKEWRLLTNKTSQGRILWPTENWFVFIREVYDGKESHSYALMDYNGPNTPHYDSRHRTKKFIDRSAKGYVGSWYDGGPDCIEVMYTETPNQFEVKAYSCAVGEPDKGVIVDYIDGKLINEKEGYILNKKDEWTISAKYKYVNAGETYVKNGIFQDPRMPVSQSE